MLFANNTSLCKKQWVRTIVGLRFATRDTKPFTKPTMDGAPTVHITAQES